jgi:hypothetical protein
MDPELVFYPPYKKYMLRKQVSLLVLWDYIGVLHEESKQVWGNSLEIIGFTVNLSAMTLTIPDDKCLDIIAAICDFVDTSVLHSCPLCSWQCMLGWANWMLNAYPLLKPALWSSYTKISGKAIAHAPVLLNKAVIHDLSWFADHLAQASCVHLLDATIWDAADADFSLWCDTSELGLGFWSPTHHLGFISPLDPSLSPLPIFFHEALCVLCALLWASEHPPIPHCLAIFTDSLNTVHIFHSLHADPLYNPILFLAVEVMLCTDINLHVFHMPSFNNFVADALSCLLPNVAVSHIPGLSVSSFIPPWDALGACLQ